MYSIAIIVFLVQSIALPANSLSQIACEGTVLNLTCPDGYHINVLGANYGRTQRDVCVDASLDDSDVFCFMPNSSRIVISTCQDESNCIIYAANGIFGDPCKGEMKYLQVNYTCEPVHIVTCDMHEEYLSCGPWCPETCPVPFRSPLPCLNQCRSGCFCSDGFIKDKLSGECVGSRYCPRWGSPCSTHEVFVETGAACQASCDYPNTNSTKCQDDTPGYVCMSGYLRDLLTGNCIPQESCNTCY